MTSLTSAHIEVLAATGLDEALIGTALRGTREVLAYDFSKAFEIILEQCKDSEEAERYMSEMATSDSVNAPIFICFGETNDIYDAESSFSTSIH